MRHLAAARPLHRRREHAHRREYPSNEGTMVQPIFPLPNFPSSQKIDTESTEVYTYYLKKSSSLFLFFKQILGVNRVFISPTAFRFDAQTNICVEVGTF